MCGGARTGATFASHDVDNVNVQFLNLQDPGGFSLVLLPNARFGAAGTGSGLGDYTGEPKVAGAFALDFVMHQVPFINDLGLYWSGSRVGSASLSAASLDLDGGVFHHAHVEVSAASGGRSSIRTIRRPSSAANSTSPSGSPTRRPTRFTPTC